MKQKSNQSSVELFFPHALYPACNFLIIKVNPVKNGESGTCCCCWQSKFSPQQPQSGRRVPTPHPYRSMSNPTLVYRHTHQNLLKNFFNTY